MGGLLKSSLGLHRCSLADMLRTLDIICVLALWVEMKMLVLIYLHLIYRKLSNFPCPRNSIAGIWFQIRVERGREDIQIKKRVYLT